MLEVLDRSGSTPEPEEEGIYACRLADGLVSALGREELRFTFRKRLATAEGVELASPGSWLHDQLLRYAGDRGRVAACYLAPREDLDREAVIARRRRGRPVPVELRERRYGIVLLFTFRLSYYSEPPEERVETVAYDVERGRITPRGLPRRGLGEAEPGPREGFGPAPGVSTRPAFHQAWETVQDRVEACVHALQQVGREVLEKELATLERYYRQLMEEERRVLKTRSTRRGQEESRRKIDLYKLEWERRVQEETERLQPQVVAALGAVARVGVPLERWRCRTGEGGDTEIWVDLARAEAWEARGPAPGTR